MDVSEAMAEESTIDEKATRAKWFKSIHWPRRQTQSSEQADRTWQTKFFRLGPLLGISALAYLLLSIPAAAAILATSDRKPVDSWKVEPHVYLGLLTALGNKCLGFAVAQGAIITWWLRALQGSTLEKLHQDWAMGTSLYEALTAGKKTGFLAFTTICGSLILGEGVLLQRATSTSLEIRSDASDHRIDPQMLYHTEWRFFWGGASVQIFCVAVVAITYWNWWTLGRAVSFSPIEIAKAFDAPLLRTMPPNLDADALAERLTDRRVRYGAVDVWDVEANNQPVGRLLFADPGNVCQPRETFALCP